jgi:hypothetical protein
VERVINGKLQSFEMGRFLQSTRKIRSRAASSGIGISISRSNRPGRRNPASIPSGRDVAPITVTCTSLCSNASNDEPN